MRKLSNMLNPDLCLPHSLQFLRLKHLSIAGSYFHGASDTSCLIFCNMLKCPSLENCAVVIFRGEKLATQAAFPVHEKISFPKLHRFLVRITGTTGVPGLYRR